MKPSITNHRQGRLFETRLSDQLNPKHELIKLAELIDWNYLDKECSSIYVDSGLGGQPPKPVRLIIGLLMLQHIHNLSDEEVVYLWVENPYWQLFCGYDFLQWEAPIDPTSLIHWRKRLGNNLLEKILKQTIQVGLQTKTVKKSSFKRVISDTTVMEKNIAFPKDGDLYDTARNHLVSIAEKSGIKLRQNYNKVSKIHLIKIDQYAHAKQFKKMKKEIKKLKTYLQRISRDIKRKWSGKEANFNKIMPLVEKLLTQEKDSKNKLYSISSPEVECIAKGKAHKKYEFGCKVALVGTHKEGFCLSIGAVHGNPYDGHTLEEAIIKAENNCDAIINEIFVDDGYRGVIIPGKEIYKSRQKQGITPRIKKLLKRRQAIEPHIGHMKMDGKLGRNYLKGKSGDKNNALLSGIGHNLRMILRKLRIIFVQIIFSIKNWVKNDIEELLVVHF